MSEKRINEVISEIYHIISLHKNEFYKPVGDGSRVYWRCWCCNWLWPINCDL